MCLGCKARRDLVRQAFLRSAYGQTAAHALKGAAEALGLKEKTGEQEVKAQTESVDPIDPPEPEKRKTKTSGVSG